MASSWSSAIPWPHTAAQYRLLAAALLGGVAVGCAGYYALQAARASGRRDGGGGGAAPSHGADDADDDAWGVTDTEAEVRPPPLARPPPLFERCLLGGGVGGG